MALLSRWWCATVLVFASACSAPSAPSSVAVAQTFAFDFRDGRAGWQDGFAGYRVSNASEYNYAAEYRPLDGALAGSGSALYATSKDLEGLGAFMFYKRSISGLAPLQRYSVSMAMEIATDTPSGCTSAGGAAPGEGVLVKAGARSSEPTVFVDGNGIERLNLKKNEPAGSVSAEAVPLGHIANGDPCVAIPGGGGLNRVWKLKALSTASVEITSDSNGSAWLVFGTDSSAVAVTRVYFTKFSATFSPK